MAAMEIAAHIKRLLESVQQPALAAFLADWPLSFRIRSAAPAALPVLRWLPAIAGDPGAFGVDVVAALCRTAATLEWRQSYSAADLGAFLDNYAWTEIMGLTGPVMSERIACGFLLLGPSTHYPPHHHEAEEFYLPLSGTAAWQQGGAEWRYRSPGSAIHHASGEVHAMRTGAEPLLALYLWRSTNLAQHAQLERSASTIPT
jgi:quercetin dioxygenase-like cupin family protein